MLSRITLEPAFILHRWPYRNTSLIVELFTQNHGRVAVVARSARGVKSRYKGVLQPFSPLLVAWVGRNELKSLGNIELCGASNFLEGNALACGFYLNELLVRLLHREDPHPNLFALYQTSLAELQHLTQIEKTLRIFEKNLLHELGYGLPLKHEAESGNPIDPSANYQYVPEQGFVRCFEGSFSGQSIMALQSEELEEEQTLKEVKLLMRIALTHHLGSKPLKSRDLFS